MKINIPSFLISRFVNISEQLQPPKKPTNDSWVIDMPPSLDGRVSVTVTYPQMGAGETTEERSAMSEESSESSNDDVMLQSIRRDVEVESDVNDRTGACFFACIFCGCCTCTLMSLSVGPILLGAGYATNNEGLITAGIVVTTAVTSKCALNCFASCVSHPSTQYR